MLACGMTAAELRPLVLNLPPEERRRLANEVWDSLADEGEDGEEPVTPAAIEKWILEELERRVEEFDKNPESGLTWEQVEHNILTRHAARQKQRS